MLLITSTGLKSPYRNFQTNLHEQNNPPTTTTGLATVGSRL